MSSAPVAATTAPAPAASSAPVMAEATPEQRKAQLKATIADVRELLKKDRCAPNQPVAIRGHDAVFFTFTCDQELSPDDSVARQGITYIDWRDGKVIEDRGDDVSVESNPQGFLFKVERGEVEVAVYRLAHGIYKAGAHLGTFAVRFVEGGWKEYAGPLPSRVSEGRPVGPKDRTPMFPVEKSGLVTFCPSGVCRATTDWQSMRLGELFEAWDGERYSVRAPGLKPHHEAYLKAVRRYADDYIAWRNRTAPLRAAAAASAAASASAAPSAPASPLATWAASYGNAPPLDPALGSPTQPNPRASADRRGCPLSVLLLTADLYLYEQLTGIDEGNASGHAGALLHDFPFDRCTSVLPGTAEDYRWPEFKKRLEGLLPEK